MCALEFPVFPNCPDLCNKPVMLPPDARVGCQAGKQPMPTESGLTWSVGNQTRYLYRQLHFYRFCFIPLFRLDVKVLSALSLRNESAETESRSWKAVLNESIGQLYWLCGLALIHLATKVKIGCWSISERPWYKNDKILFSRMKCRGVRRRSWLPPVMQGVCRFIWRMYQTRGLLGMWLIAASKIYNACDVLGQNLTMEIKFRIAHGS